MELFQVKILAREGGFSMTVPRDRLEPISEVVKGAPSGNVEVISCGLISPQARELFLAYVLTEYERDAYFINTYRARLAATEPTPFADLMNLAASLRMHELLKACESVLLSLAPKRPETTD